MRGIAVHSLHIFTELLLTSSNHVHIRRRARLHDTTPPQTVDMSLQSLDERPAKKRRFFVEDEPVDDSTLSSVPDKIDAVPEPGQHVETVGEAPFESDASNTAFDADLFASFVGEQVPDSTLKKLQELSVNDIQRGMLHSLDVESASDM